LALDADFAGDAAARRGITIASNAGVEVKVAKISDYKDPDEAARKNPDGYKKNLIAAQGIWDYLIDSVFVRFPSGSGADKAKISKEIIPILSEIEDKIVQAHYVNLLAEKLGVPLEAVSEQISKIVKGATESGEPGEEEKGETRRMLLEKRLLGLAFASDPRVLLRKDVLDLITEPLNKKIIEEYTSYSKRRKTFVVSDFGKALPKELFDGFSQMVLNEGIDYTDKPDELTKELDLILKELKILDIKDTLKLLATEMRKLEGSGEKEKLLTAQNKFNKLAEALSKLIQNTESGVIFSE
jgi:DNA primase